MVGSFIRFAAAASFSLSLAACAGGASDYAANYSRPVTRGTHIESYSGPHEECVPYARARSGVDVHGDAWTWWDKTEGKYAHNSEPVLGSVLVLTGYAGPHRAHLAYVSSMVSAREIRIDHANWLNDGDVYTDDPVVDVSPDNDWSEVRVFNPRAANWGTKTYVVQGFIGPGPDSDRVALEN
ncbi:MAG: CHAP domain-containing protein [Rhizomicrobium sp.]